eukprot:g46593.t1
MPGRHSKANALTDEFWGKILKKKDYSLEIEAAENLEAFSTFQKLDTEHGDLASGIFDDEDDDEIIAATRLAERDNRADVLSMTPRSRGRDVHSLTNLETATEAGFMNKLVELTANSQSAASSHQYLNAVQILARVNGEVQHEILLIKGVGSAQSKSVVGEQSAEADSCSAPVPFGKACITPSAAPGGGDVLTVMLDAPYIENIRIQAEGIRLMPVPLDEIGNEIDQAKSAFSPPTTPSRISLGKGKEKEKHRSSPSDQVKHKAKQSPAPRSSLKNPAGTAPSKVAKAPVSTSPARASSKTAKAKPTLTSVSESLATYLLEEKEKEDAEEEKQAFSSSNAASKDKEKEKEKDKAKAAEKARSPTPAAMTPKAKAAEKARSPTIAAITPKAKAAEMARSPTPAATTPTNKPHGGDEETAVVKKEKTTSTSAESDTSRVETAAAPSGSTRTPQQSVGAEDEIVEESQQTQAATTSNIVQQTASSEVFIKQEKRDSKNTTTTSSIPSSVKREKDEEEDANEEETSEHKPKDSSNQVQSASSTPTRSQSAGWSSRGSTEKPFSPRSAHGSPTHGSPTHGPLTSAPPPLETPGTKEAKQKQKKLSGKKRKDEQEQLWDKRKLFGSPNDPDQILLRGLVLDEKSYTAKPDASLMAEPKVNPDFLWVLCDRCQNWRRLPDEYRLDCLPKKWFCEMNPDSARSTCHVPQEPELNKIMRYTDDFCSICLQPANAKYGVIYGCRGGCMRAFHETCVDLKRGRSGVDLDWFCGNCIEDSHSCFECHLPGRVTEDLWKCPALCGHFFHPSCLQNSGHSHRAPKVVEDDSKSRRRKTATAADRSKMKDLQCGHHRCHSCGQPEGIPFERRLTRCARCSVAYHQNMKCRGQKKMHLITPNTFICSSHKTKHGDLSPARRARRGQSQALLELRQLSAYQINKRRPLLRILSCASQLPPEENKEPGSANNGSNASSSSSSSSTQQARVSPPTSKRRRGDESKADSVNPVEKRYGADGLPLMPVRVNDNLYVLHLGYIVYDRALYHTQHYIYPVGYKAACIQASTLDSTRQCLYVFDILDGGPAPLFKVTPADEPDSPVIANTPSRAWQGILQRIQNLDVGLIQSDVQLPPLLSPGEYVTGLASRHVQSLLCQLPFASQCKFFHAFSAPHTKRALPSSQHSSMSISVSEVALAADRTLNDQEAEDIEAASSYFSCLTGYDWTEPDAMRGPDYSSVSRLTNPSHTTPSSAKRPRKSLSMASVHVTHTPTAASKERESRESLTVQQKQQAQQVQQVSDDDLDKVEQESMVDDEEESSQGTRQSETGATSVQMSVEAPVAVSSTIPRGGRGPGPGRGHKGKRKTPAEEKEELQIPQDAPHEAKRRGPGRPRGSCDDKMSKAREAGPVAGAAAASPSAQPPIAQSTTLVRSGSGRFVAQGKRRSGKTVAKGGEKDTNVASVAPDTAAPAPRARSTPR